MNKVAFYVHSGTRENTRKSYQNAVAQFEQSGGLLPATSESIARYLTEHAGTLSMNTLRLRLAGLAQWHIEQGFSDPTKSTLITKVLRGIQREHPKKPKQAKALQFEDLQSVDRWLQHQIHSSIGCGNRIEELKHKRNRSLLLLSFWRGFRGDEITKLNVEHIQVEPGVGMTCFLNETKTDVNYKGTTFKVPALSQMCPVEAYLDWITSAHIQGGSVYRSMDRWGHISDSALHIDSLTPLIQTIFSDAGIANPSDYSGHSFRRGFANWAGKNGWDLKSLMEYVGWKSVTSAMRYLDSVDPFAKQQFESALSLPGKIKQLTVE